MNSNNIEGILKDIFGMSLLDAKKIENGDKRGDLGNKKINASFGTIKLGYVTPGLWEITVEGKIGDNVVMRGVTNVHFRNAI